MKPLIIKVLSDGTAAGTRVIDVESGRQIDGVTSIDFRINNDLRVAEVKLGLISVPIEFEAEVTETKPPLDGFLGE